MKISLCLVLLVALLGAPLAASAAPAYPFFAFCMDTHDSQHRTLQQQAEMLKALGYDGAGHLWLDQVKERLETLEAVGLKLYQISIRVDISKEKEAYDPRLKDVLPLLKGRDVMINLLMSGGKPSDTAGDPRAVAIIKEIADLAQPSGTAHRAVSAFERLAGTRRRCRASGQTGKQTECRRHVQPLSLGLKCPMKSP